MIKVFPLVDVGRLTNIFFIFVYARRFYEAGEHEFDFFAIMKRFRLGLLVRRPTITKGVLHRHVLETSYPSKPLLTL